MAKPIGSTPVLEGKEAIKFLREMEKVDALKPNDPEYKKRERFFKECKDILIKNPNLRVDLLG